MTKIFGLALFSSGMTFAAFFSDQDVLKWIGLVSTAGLMILSLYQRYRELMRTQAAADREASWQDQQRQRHANQRVRRKPPSSQSDQPSET